MKSKANKVLMDLGGITVLEHSISALADLDEIAEFVLVISANDKSRCEDQGVLDRLKELGVRKVVTGGATRFDSAEAGVRACSESSKLILIHDGARPYPPIDAVRRAIFKAAASGGAILAVPLQDTLKKVSADEAVITGTIPREGLYRAQTPQVFRQPALKKAMATARERGLSPTDDSLLLEEAGSAPSIVQGSPNNIKITTEEDLALARALLAIKQNPGD